MKYEYVDVWVLVPEQAEAGPVERTSTFEAFPGHEELAMLVIID